MASRTVVDSVERVDGPPEDLEQLERDLASLGQRHPGVIWARYGRALPAVARGVFVASGAAIVGDVALADEVSVWFGCVLRGDVNRIRIGRGSNLQDGAVVHVGDQDPCIVEEDVVVGHRAVLHGCQVGGGTLIGIQATVLDGAVIGEGSVVGAGALVTARMQIPPRSLALGAPAKVVKTLSEADEAFHRALAGKYRRLAHNYLRG